MKIEKSINPLPPSSLNESNTRNAQSKAANTPSSSQGVNVSIGSASSQMRTMEASVNNTSAVDSKKVAEIKQAISEGRFQVNTAAIADRLINDVKELLNASKS